MIFTPTEPNFNIQDNNNPGKYFLLWENVKVCSSKMISCHKENFTKTFSSTEGANQLVNCWCLVFEFKKNSLPNEFNRNLDKKNKPDRIYWYLSTSEERDANFNNIINQQNNSGGDCLFQILHENPPNPQDGFAWIIQDEFVSGGDLIGMLGITNPDRINNETFLRVKTPQGIKETKLI